METQKDEIYHAVSSLLMKTFFVVYTNAVSTRVRQSSCLPPLNEIHAKMAARKLTPLRRKKTGGVGGEMWA